MLTGITLLKYILTISIDLHVNVYMYLAKCIV